MASSTEILNRLASQADDLDKIFKDYNATVIYKDDFDDGEMHGWQYQYDTNNRVGITLDNIAMTGNYSLLLHSRPAASDQAWARKGVVVPSGVRKILVGAYFMFHAANANNPSTLNFDFDWQTSSGGSSRHYFRFQFQNHDGTSLLTKWRLNTGTPTSQSFTDATGGTMNVPWNESDKPMLCYMVGVIDAVNNKYEALYFNGTKLDLTAQNIGPAVGADLANFQGGAIHIMAVENRSNSSEDNLFWIEKPTLGYVF